ncbi:MAG: WbqC family protein [candidate division KSB1 bacterium]
MQTASHTFAAHPLQYFSGVNFWSKAAQVESLVLADDLQFRTQGEGNRMRLKTNEGATWLTVPVLTKGRAGQQLKDVRIDNLGHWRAKHWKTLRCHYGRAPYFEKYADRVEKIFAREWQYLADLNFAAFEFLRKELRLTCEVRRSTEWAIAARGSERIIEMGRRLNRSRYLTDRANQKFLHEEKFAAAGMAVAYADFAPQPYHQQYGEFAPNLSALDLLFNEGEEASAFL